MRPGTTTADSFRWQMKLVQRYFTPMSLPEALHRMREGILPPNTACVTFDDGYADNAAVAFPIMKEYGIPLTVFVASGYLDGGRMWNDSIIESLRCTPAGDLNLSSLGLPVYQVDDPESRRLAAYNIIDRAKYLDQSHRQEVVDCLASQVDSLPDDLMLTSNQLQYLVKQGVEIGGHTVTHPILARLKAHEAKSEIEEGRARLQELTGQSVRLFAYPNGKHGVDYTQEHVRLVEAAGFEAAVSTDWGTSTKRTNRFQLPRFTPWDKTPAKYLLRLLLNSRI